MKVTYDKDSDAVYIEFADVQQAGGFSELTQGEWPIHVNITKKGILMGIEVMNASTIFTKAFLDAAERID